MYVCNRGFRKAISCFFDRSGWTIPPRQGSLVNPLCYGFLTPRPVLGAPQSSGGPSLTPQSLRVRVSCGTRRVRTLVLREFKEQSTGSRRCNPTNAGRRHFELHRFPPAMGRSHTSPRAQREISWRFHSIH